ncbi:GYF domain-containing protein [Schlesneria paludicola]|uniref:GYF domain-containing protein n=1 Tax=Schlesneria paludicola TaxID=360056 RepID=UPI000299FD3E|nr:GYF domain-containing protein [Schlesneria paludicola]
MDENDKYYIRVRGRVLGPYSLGQLKTLRTRGQFGRANEVSLDRDTWESAAAIEHLFAPEASKNARAATDDDASDSATSKSTGRVWHYAVGEEQCGPTTLLELRGMIVGNQLMVDDLVWKDGMDDWKPIREVAELRSIAQKSNSSADINGRSITSTTHVYCFACGSPTDSRAEVCPKCGVRQRSSSGNRKRERVTAALLALFLGGIGIHHFYLGNVALGVLYLVFCLTLIPAIAAWVEFVIFLCMTDANFDAKYA